MNVSLTPELDKLVKMKVESGLYNSARKKGVRSALDSFSKIIHQVYKLAIITLSI